MIARFNKSILMAIAFLLSIFCLVFMLLIGAPIMYILLNKDFTESLEKSFYLVDLVERME